MRWWALLQLSSRFGNLVSIYAHVIAHRGSAGSRAADIQIGSSGAPTCPLVSVRCVDAKDAPFQL